MKLLTIILLAGASFSPAPMSAQGKEMPLWPSLAPGTETEANTERCDEKKELYDVYQPRLSAFLPAKRDTLLPAMIVCPGGGYRNLAMEKEGYKVARWLREEGIAAFVLIYRLDPARALQDAQRAVSLIRADAGKFNIDGHKIGVMGFSAGAHLAANLATHFQRKEVHDSIDGVSSRPDFWIGVYGAYEPVPRAEGVNSQFASFTPFSQDVSHNTPPAFLVHAGDDPRAPVLHSVRLYEALKEHGVPAELHVYEKGSHGFALEENRGDAVTSTVRSWSARCLEWLRLRGVQAR